MDEIVGCLAFLYWLSSVSAGVPDVLRLMFGRYQSSLEFSIYVNVGICT